MIKRPGSAKPRQIYWKNCSVCQYMKKNPTFRLRVMQSSYFKPGAKETLTDVIHDFGDPVPVNNVYKHMERHQAKDLLTAARRYDEVNKDIPVVAAVEGEVLSDSAHERGLDAFIQMGREKLERNEMNITATNYLAAIKIKADIEKGTKDRRAEMAKAFFSGRGLGNGQESPSPRQ